MWQDFEISSTKKGYTRVEVDDVRISMGAAASGIACKYAGKKQAEVSSAYQTYPRLTDDEHGRTCILLGFVVDAGEASVKAAIKQFASGLPVKGLCKVRGVRCPVISDECDDYKSMIPLINKNRIMQEAIYDAYFYGTLNTAQEDYNEMISQYESARATAEYFEIKFRNRYGRCPQADELPIHWEEIQMRNVKGEPAFFVPGIDAAEKSAGKYRYGREAVDAAARLIRQYAHERILARNAEPEDADVEEIDEVFSLLPRLEDLNDVEIDDEIDDVKGKSELSVGDDEVDVFELLPRLEDLNDVEIDDKAGDCEAECAIDETPEKEVDMTWQEREVGANVDDENESAERAVFEESGADELSRREADTDAYFTELALRCEAASATVEAARAALKEAERIEEESYRLLDETTKAQAQKWYDELCEAGLHLLPTIVFGDSRGKRVIMNTAELKIEGIDGLFKFSCGTEQTKKAYAEAARDVRKLKDSLAKIRESIERESAEESVLREVEELALEYDLALLQSEDSVQAGLQIGAEKLKFLRGRIYSISNGRVMAMFKKEGVRFYSDGQRIEPEEVVLIMEGGDEELAADKEAQLAATEAELAAARAELERARRRVDELARKRAKLRKEMAAINKYMKVA